MSVQHVGSGFVIFRMEVKKYTISCHLGDRVQPKQATRYVFKHPPYSRNLAPSDFHIFLELKNKLGGILFQLNKEVKVGVAASF